MKKCFTLLALVAACQACAQPIENGGWQAAKQQASQAFEAGNCAEVWRQVWPWARGGNSQALALLASGAHAAGLAPPGARQDGLARLRHILILAVHGANDSDPANLALLHALLQEPLLAQMGGKELRLCLLGKQADQSCVSAAIRRGFIPTLADYAGELDSLAKRHPASQAVCDLPQAGPLPQMRQ